MRMFNIQFVNSGVFLEKAQALRHKVFFKDAGRDEDRFDKFCHHIVATEKNSQSVVGTYRLLLGSVARKHSGFYSETEFDLSNIKKHCEGELLELGRSCVDPEYRRYPILALMWREIILFMAEKNVQYTFGCASIEDPRPHKIAEIFSWLKTHHYSPPIYRVTPLPEKSYPYKAGLKHCSNEEALHLLPSLIKGYLRMGAVLCGEPMWDQDFNTADFFLLLENKKMSTTYKKRFL